jgi:hypothetical protein
MKHLVLCFSFLLVVMSPLFGQSKKVLKAQLAKDLGTYQRVTERMEYDSLFLFMPPKMFDIVPADSLAELMQKSMDNEYMSIKMTGMRFHQDASKIKKTDAYHWTLVRYDAGMDMQFKSSIDSATNKIMVAMMKSQFGREQVSLKNDSLLHIDLKDKQLLAFKAKENTHWYFIEDKRTAKGQEGKQQRAILESVVPEEVLKAMEKG